VARAATVGLAGRACRLRRHPRGAPRAECALRDQQVDVDARGLVDGLPRHARLTGQQLRADGLDGFISISRTL